MTVLRALCIALSVLVLVLFFAVVDLWDKSRAPKYPAEDVRAIQEQREAARRSKFYEAEYVMVTRRLAHVCPEAFPLPQFATRPMTNTMPKPLSADDLLRYNRCAEASKIAR